MSPSRPGSANCRGDSLFKPYVVYDRCYNGGRLIRYLAQHNDELVTADAGYYIALWLGSAFDHDERTGGSDGCRRTGSPSLIFLTVAAATRFRAI